MTTRAPITLLLIVLSIALFIGSELSRPGPLAKNDVWLHTAPAFSPVEKALFFDYTGFDALVDGYGANPSKESLQKLSSTSFWPGAYAITLSHLTNSPLPSPPYPLFEQIREGQLWRLFTPALLHGSLFHLFFNVVWLFFLGTMVEQRIGLLRYLIVIVAAVCLSNIAQYLMSGPYFLGLSGLIMALVGFIWVRHKRVPSENWPIPTITLTVIAAFVGIMFFLQCLFFILQVLGYPAWSTNMANTSHLTGALVGALLGLSSFFRLRRP